MSNPHNLKAGDTLYCVDTSGYRNEDHTTVKVVKVARKYATILRGRVSQEIHLDSLRGKAYNGYSPYLQCYHSESHYKSEMERQHTWNRLTTLVRHRPTPPKRMRLDDMQRLILLVEAK